MPISIKDITRATPTILRILVIDEDFVKYPLVELDTVDPSHPTESWVSRTNPYTNQAENCRIVGDGTWLNFEPTEPTDFLDRAEADDYTNYSDIGSVSPIAVYRKSYAHHQREASGGTHGNNMCNMRHELFVEYDGTIPDGQHTMAVTGNFIPSTKFLIADKSTRCDNIRATQIGHKPTDPKKLARMSVWIPGRGTEGQVDLGLAGEDFHIINQAGDIVHTGTIALHMSPTDQERGGQIALSRNAGTTGRRRCTSVTVGNPTQFNIPDHGYSEGEEKFFSSFSGLSAFSRNWRTISIVDADNISVAVDSTGQTYTPGFYVTEYDSQIHDAVFVNRAGTYVYNLDYSSFEPTAGNYGKHRIYVPGYGVSWPFEVDPAARFVAIKNSVKGYISQCWGMSASWGQAGWNKPYQYRDGKRGQKVYESSRPGCMDSEGSYGFGTGLLGHGYYLFYDGEVSAFTTRHQNITGGTSGEEARIADIIDNGSSGYLVLCADFGQNIDDIASNFIDNETITGAKDGEAVVDLTKAAIDFDGQTGAFTTSLTVTGGTSGATGVIDSIEDNGTHGVLFLSSVSGTFEDDETITDTSTGSATTHLPRGQSQFEGLKIGGMAAEWQTVNRVNDWQGGGFIDAGDWDIHPVRHAESCWNLLDMAYEYVPASQRNLDYGFPRSSQTIDRDLYGEIDGLGCPVHMAIWYLEWFRRTQKANGSVYSGTQYTTGAAGNEFEPSWIATDVDMYLLAADQHNNFVYADVAAKLGRILKDEGYTTLGDMWIDSAEDAYNWADDVFTDFRDNGVASTGAWRDHFITDLDLLSKTNMTKARLATNASAMSRRCEQEVNSLPGSKQNASASLWRAKGGIDDAYNTNLKRASSFQQTSPGRYAAWEYINGPDLGDNTSVRASINMEDWSDTYNVESIADNFSYNSMPIYDSGTDDIQPVWPSNEKFWPWYQQVTGYSKYLDAICIAEDYVGGVNQLGMCFTTGIGYNPPDPILHRDQEWANIEPLPGYTIYVRGGPSGMVEVQYATGHLRLHPTVSGNNESQSQWPRWECYPIHEQHVRNTFSVYSTEFVTQEQIVGRICNLIWLHTWDGTGTLELTNAPKPGVLSL